jgi:hypothetical protein
MLLGGVELPDLSDGAIARALEPAFARMSSFAGGKP